LAPGWKGLERKKYSGLFALTFIDEEKSFITLTSGVNLIKPFSFVTKDPDKILTAYLGAPH
jgi:hypothetical protein